MRDHPFETGFEFRSALVNDKDLLESCLRELQRVGWPAMYGDGLVQLLETIGYATSGAERWEQLVRDVALAYRRSCGHCLKPEPSAASLEGIAVETIHALQDRLTAHKRERGLISYEDMLTQVDAALDPRQNPRAGLLQAALQARYRFGIVDEFQDTDPVQWRIFKRIFVEKEGRQRLLVVGDPKQAIFGFRGADLQAYLHAIRELSAEAGARQERLGVNWRTCPELLKPLNMLFGSGWFCSDDIRYASVDAPAEKERIHSVVADETGRSALTLVDLRFYDSLKAARWAHARFMAREIKRLLSPVDGRPLLVIKKKDDSEPRALRAGDVCILIFRRGEAGPIMQCLRNAKIPYSFYKQPGLWRSGEAEQLAYLLRSLARPEDPSALRTALLTSFFRIPPERLAAPDSLPENAPAVCLFRKWCGLAAKRRWGELFHSLLEETGVLFDNLADPRYERTTGQLPPSVSSP